ncbi:TetR family transcriptional regulator, partial [Streptomyces milbemycinicus]|uniref:TetR family transcriptional regulator n=1 Tax=Streptomyces milbemycinicus TaxID=476552 RepID=UPI003CCB8C23
MAITPSKRAFQSSISNDRFKWSMDRLPESSARFTLVPMNEPQPAPAPAPALPTLDRLLDAAERLFGEHGFAATSLRTVTVAADANVAAVNY